MRLLHSTPACHFSAKTNNSKMPTNTTKQHQKHHQPNKSPQTLQTTNDQPTILPASSFSFPTQKKTPKTPRKTPKHQQKHQKPIGFWCFFFFFSKKDVFLGISFLFPDLWPRRPRRGHGLWTSAQLGGLAPGFAALQRPLAKSVGRWVWETLEGEESGVENHRVEIYVFFWKKNYVFAPKNSLLTYYYMVFWYILVEFKARQTVRIG